MQKLKSSEAPNFKKKMGQTVCVKKVPFHKSGHIS